MLGTPFLCAENWRHLQSCDMGSWLLLCGGEMGTWFPLWVSAEDADAPLAASELLPDLAYPRMGFG